MRRGKREERGGKRKEKGGMRLGDGAPRVGGGGDRRVEGRNCRNIRLWKKNLRFSCFG